MKVPVTNEEEDRLLGEAAVREAEAQLMVSVALAKLPTHPQRARVLRVVEHLLRADEEMPGVVDAFLRGQKKPKACEG